MKREPLPVHRVDFTRVSDNGDHWRFKCQASGETGQHFPAYCGGSPLTIWDDKASKCEVANVEHVSARAKAKGGSK